MEGNGTFTNNISYNCESKTHSRVHCVVWLGLHIAESIQARMLAYFADVVDKCLTNI